MKVFISWSGTKSKETAEVLSSWIRQVIQAAETWISLDIDKGARWNESINKELEQTKVGIICLNKENLTSEWILFEAGALSKTSDAYVCTFLLNVNPADIKPPLGQFQHTTFAKQDVLKLMRTINNKIKDCSEKTIPEKDLDEVFEVFWPKLEEKLNTIKNSNESKTEQPRLDRDILEEILQVVRGNNVLKPVEKDKITSGLLQRNKVLEQFAFMVSHSLRSSLAKILGFTELLKDSDKTSTEREFFIDELSLSVNKMNEIVDDLNKILEVKQKIIINYNNKDLE